MPIEIIDTKAFGHEKKARTVVLDTNRFHVWVHYYKPGQTDEMHCHNQDQTFQIVEGQCTMSFPDGGASELGPGMLVTITGGSFYQLLNSGSEPLIMIGTRSGATKDTVKVEHGTGRVITRGSAPYEPAKT